MESSNQVPKTIVFTLTKLKACNIYSHLNAASCMKGAVGMYHANLTAHNKTLVHDHFKRGVIRILVATVAYGMVRILSFLTHNSSSHYNYVCNVRICIYRAWIFPISSL